MRVPYFIDMFIWSREFCEVRISTAGPSIHDDRNGLFNGGLSMDFVEFFYEHGVCNFCGAPVTRDLSRCACGKPRGKFNHLVVKFATSLDQSHFKKLYDREGARVANAKRKRMIQENGGTFNRGHIKGMHAAQRGLCYFCGTSIKFGSKSLHVDHYEPIAEGGKNDLSNMVLACARCNLLKNAMHGDRFDYRARKFRAPEFKAILRVVRRDLKAYKLSATNGPLDSPTFTPSNASSTSP